MLTLAVVLLLKLALFEFIFLFSAYFLVANAVFGLRCMLDRALDASDSISSVDLKSYGLPFCLLNGVFAFLSSTLL